MRKPDFPNYQLFNICWTFGWICGAFLKYPNFGRFYTQSVILFIFEVGIEPLLNSSVLVLAISTFVIMICC